MVQICLMCNREVIRGHKCEWWNCENRVHQICFERFRRAACVNTLFYCPRCRKRSIRSMREMSPVVYTPPPEVHARYCDHKGLRRFLRRKKAPLRYTD